MTAPEFVVQLRNALYFRTDHLEKYEGCIGMTVTLDLNPETEQGLLMQAQARGVSLTAYLQDVLNKQAVIGIGAVSGKDIEIPLLLLGISGSLRRADIYDDEPQRPLKTGRGLLAKYGAVPSAEEIDENRHDMFGGFARLLMIAGVADTHAALWHLFDDKRLSATAANFIDRAAAHGQRIAVSAINLAEIIYLVEKGECLCRSEARPSRSRPRSEGSAVLDRHR